MKRKEEIKKRPNILLSFSRVAITFLKDLFENLSCLFFTTGSRYRYKCNFVADLDPNPRYFYEDPKHFQKADHGNETLGRL